MSKGRYILRLDDACEKRNMEQWDRMEKLLDQYKVKPLIGIIPHCEDPLMEQYPSDREFWNRVKRWREKGWVIAMHGYNHVYGRLDGGLNPVNRRSEFAGEPPDIQKEKIRAGVTIMRDHGIDPKVFFAPAHTFDRTTISALLEESNIRIISDTPASRPYQKYGITFVPQQSGRVRPLPLHMVTFCYHPNTMNDEEFLVLEKFLQRNKFRRFPIAEVTRKLSLFDKVLMKVYYTICDERTQVLRTKS